MARCKRPASRRGSQARTGQGATGKQEHSPQHQEHRARYAWPASGAFTQDVFSCRMGMQMVLIDPHTGHRVIMAVNVCAVLPMIVSH